VLEDPILEMDKAIRAAEARLNGKTEIVKS
jgi:hypothetical protein